MQNRHREGRVGVVCIMETRIFKLLIDTDVGEDVFPWAEDDAREFVIVPEPTVIKFEEHHWAYSATQRVLRKRLRRMVASGKEQAPWIVPSFTQEELAHVKKWILAEAL